jgi:carboxypeptidase C (cathepsin A)
LGNQGGNPKINLLGFAVGNACWGNAVGTCAFGWDNDVISTEFYFGHALFSQITYDKVIAACGNLTNPAPTDDCNNALNLAGNEVDSINNVYDIYDTCPSPVSGQAHMLKRIPPSKHSKRVGQQAACIEPNVFAGTWRGLSSVQQALHVAVATVTSWSVCNFAVNIGYDRSVASLLPLYPTLIKNYRVLVYSGDTDSCVPETGSERWSYGLGFPVQDAWRPWVSAAQQVNGYVQTYNANGFTFATVKGAGHMAPQYQPSASFDMFSRWVANTPL